MYSEYDLTVFDAYFNLMGLGDSLNENVIVQDEHGPEFICDGLPQHPQKFTRPNYLS